MKQTTLFLGFLFAILGGYAQSETADKIQDIVNTAEAATQAAMDSATANIIYPVKFQILDTEDKPVANAELTVFTPQEVLRRGKTNEEGKVSFFGLQDGDYDVLMQFENGENIMFNNQWIATNETNERIYKIPAKKLKEKKKK